VVCPLKNNDGSNCRKRCLGVSRLFSPSQRAPHQPASIASSMANYLCPRKAISVSYVLIQPVHRKSAIAPCRSISDERTRITTSRSSRLPKRASY
jgi:hypothetical protein